jgi:hypothetical protein
MIDHPGIAAMKEFERRDNKENVVVKTLAICQRTTRQERKEKQAFLALQKIR